MEQNDREFSVGILSENGTLKLVTESRLPRNPSFISHGLFMETLEKCSKHPHLAREEVHALCSLVFSDLRCIAIEGCSGSGKTSLLKDFVTLLHKIPGEDVVFLHLGDQIDSKVLLGTYTSTITPGDFVWLPGILTRAVKSGMWIVLENLDAAPVDVISLLLPLVKNGELIVPGFIEPLKASSKFKMFCTLRESVNVGMMAHSNILKVFLAHCPIVHLRQSTGAKLSKMLQDAYSNLSIIADKLVSVCDKFGVHVRHLWKLCERISLQIYNGRITSVDDFMLEIIDCLCAKFSGDSKLAMAQKLSCLCGGISDEKVKQLCESHKPVVQISTTAISIGRAYVARHTQVQPRMCFAYTQRSLCLLESVCRCVQMNEPVLLVGETGVGKTAVINFLSQLTGNKLVVFNVSQQTDSSELLGGFKPLQTSNLVAPCREEFERLFHDTFSIKENAQYLSSIQAAYAKQKWRKLFKMMIHSVQSALQKLNGDQNQKLYQEWKSVYTTVKKFQKSLRGNTLSFSFSFIEGALVDAVRKGSWILLDEINLASPETLQCLSSLLEGPQGSFLLPEKAELQDVKRHEGFRLFCCMNPATDVGKKSLPPSIRNRFTEFYVDEVQHSDDLRLLIERYLEGFTLNISVVNGVISLYRAVCDLAQNKLEDGTGRRPHYSLRSLCRALQYARYQGYTDLLRSLYEGFCISFLSELHGDYHRLMLSTIKSCLDIPDSTLSYCLPRPPGGNYVLVEGFWLKRGNESPKDVFDYVLTDSVKKNLKNLARVVSARHFPVILQGPTSAGKTSLIQYLAKKVGQKCVRINNHEHTDLQEYVGMYTADANGQLVFQEGVLVTAMRNGYWVILDELNLAPTEVLEALNRVLDDNRELFIPETQQLVKAHSQFLLFGTQNPPGSYGGRKVLSRAFRNRFVELHFDDIPSKELEIILQQKCQLPPSYSKKMVAVMKELQEWRSTSGIFCGKYGLITLRDLFRWADRYRKTEVHQQFFNWEQHLAEDGFMLLGGRLRDANERQVISKVISKHFKCNVSDEHLFGFDGGNGSLTTFELLRILYSHTMDEFSHLVWTKELVQMAILVYRAIKFNEPVLLVGDTGCGKTTICQFLSCLLQRRMFSINCHMHTEAADFLGGLRPVRKQCEEDSKSSALFEWKDGVVVQAMKEGGCLLVDEISLAEDAVLERLNSLLESSRTLIVSERSKSQEDVYQVVAAPGFTFMATMNPGGDYGKKELSPALRNRFVEIWCSSASSRDSYGKIIMHNLDSSLTELNSPWTEMILDFLEWISSCLNTSISVRDLLSWVHFINQTLSELGPESSFYHGACLVFLDGIGCGSGKTTVISSSDAEQIVNNLLSKHEMILKEHVVTKGNKFYGISPFFIEKGPEKSRGLTSYNLEAPGPHHNAFRLLRAMQLGRPLLLEGAPGVGKTSLVTALAQASGHTLVRINLSEHTDISDLFGADLPVEGEQDVSFAWRDGPFLNALKNGYWILLDEMNLASQSVLEGLNACLDHRGEIYVPEVGKYFKVKADTKIFACQNPLQQGGGRKGLPRSFVNRFTQVFIKVLQPEDLLYITSSIFHDISINTHQKMISFTAKVQNLVNSECGVGVWEYNLRDVLRWCDLCQDSGATDPGEFVELIYCARLRDSLLRQKILEIYSNIFDAGPNFKYPPSLGSYFSVSKSSVQIGRVSLPKPSHPHFGETLQPVVPLRCQLSTLEALANCVRMNWMAIVVGDSACGKSSVIQTLAQLTGHKLVDFPMNSDTDTTELVGSFQQVNMSRHCCNVAEMCTNVVTCLLDVLKENTTGILEEYESSLLTIAFNLSNKFSPAATLDGDAADSLYNIMKQLSETVETVKSIAHACGVLPINIREMLSMLEDVNLKFVPGQNPGRFEWIDSVLVTALRWGHWLLISHANFCSSSVLDRLNCLLEPGGYLSIDERGVVDKTVPVIHPHPDFRIFLTMDPIHGEISRAMRNRGIEIFMLPNVSTMDVKLNNEDLLSVVVSTTHLDVTLAQRVLHFSQALPGMTTSKVLTLARCVASNPGDGDLSKTAGRLGFWSEEQGCEIETCSRSGVSCVILPAVDHLLYPSQCIVQRDIVCLLRLLNESKDKNYTNSRECWVVVPRLNAAFEVFVSSGTVEDRVLRQILIEQLLESLKINNVLSLEALVYIHALKEYHLWSCRDDSSKIANLIAGVNPLSRGTKSMERKGLVSLHSITLLEYLNHLVQFGNHKLLLQLSKDVFEGEYPVECLEHPSLVYLYSYIKTVLMAALEVSTHTDSLNANISLEVVLGWLRQFVHVCSLPSITFPNIACAWTLIKIGTLSSLSPQLKTASQWHFLESLATNLYPLEEMTNRSRVYESVRQAIGPGCSSRPSGFALQQKSEVVKRDYKLLQTSKKTPPFLMLCGSNFEERKHLLSEWLNDELEITDNGVNSTESVYSSSLSSPDALISISAILPAIYSLKLLLVDETSDVCSTNVLLSNLLEYIQRLSYVSVRALEPLLTLSAGKATVGSNYSSLLNCINSGYNLLVDMSSIDGTARHSLSESVCSLFCFERLSPQLQESLSSAQMFESSPLCTLGNYSVRTEELNGLAQYLWVNSNSPIFNIQQNLHLDLKCLGNTFRKFVLSLCKVGAPTKESDHVDEVSTQLVIAACNGISAIMPIVDDPYFWKTVQNELLTALMAIQKAEHNLCQSDKYDDIAVLEATAMAKIHLGLAMSLVLCPPLIDPLTISLTEQHFLDGIIEHYSSLIDAWDDYYVNMTGKQLSYFYANSNTTPEFHQMPSSLTLLHTVKNTFERIHSNRKFVSVSQSNDKKYSRFSHVCADMIKSVCSQSKVHSMLADYESHVNLDTLMNKLTSINKALSVFVHQIHSEFPEYDDVAEPFLSAILQIFGGMNSLHTLKVQTWKELTDLALTVGQYPVGNYHIMSTFEWIMILLEKSQSKSVMSMELSTCMHKRLLVVGVETAIQLCRANHLRPNQSVGFLKLLKYCWSIWRKGDDERRKKAAEEDSIYLFKSKTHQIFCSDEVHEQEVLNNLFPSYNVCNDASIVEESSVDVSDQEMDQHSPVQTHTESFSPEELYQICCLHLTVFSKEFKEKDFQTFHQPSLETYHLASYIVHSLRNLPGLSVDFLLSGAHIKMCHHQLRTLQSGVSVNYRNFDIYKDPAPSLAVAAIPVLTALADRVGELLKEWPDHPVLKQILTAIDKVLSLNVSEPLMKILSGMEYILRRAQDWEAYASSHVSMFQQLDSLMQLVLEWRKMELSCWKNLFSVCEHNLEVSSSNLWFYLHELCHDQALDEDVSLHETLLKFMEVSSVGDFDFRLKMLKAFHIEMATFEKKELSDFLGNMFYFYSQFSSVVSKSVEDLLKPLEKELKEFLEILRWNDGSYWAIKESSQKSHNKLLKFMNKYKAILEQPVKPILSVSMSSDTGAAKAEVVQLLFQELQCLNFVSDQAPHESFLVTLHTSDADIELATKDMLYKMRKHVGSFIAQDCCHTLSDHVDSLSGYGSQVMYELQSEEFLREINEEKRKAAIKLSKLRKQNALGGLFKELKKNGISYRKGSEFSIEKMLKLPVVQVPVELDAVNQAQEIIDSCYYGCITGMSAMMQAFIHPSKDLTVGQITRCKGFAACLMSNICEQRPLLSEVMHQLCTLQCYINTWRNLQNGPQQVVTRDVFSNWQSVLCSCVELCLESINSLSNLLKAMPTEFDISFSPLPEEMLYPVVRCKDRSVGERALKLLEDHRQQLNDLYGKLVHQELCDMMLFYTKDEVSDLQEEFELIKRFSESTSEALQLMFGCHPSSGVFVFLNKLCSRLDKDYEQFQHWLTSVQQCEQPSTTVHQKSNHKEQMSTLVRQILVSLQRVMVRHSSFTTKTVVLNYEFCKDLHVISMRNLSDMQMKEMLDLLKDILETFTHRTEDVLSMLQAVYPLVEQYYLLCKKLLVDLIVAHIVLSQLLLILLQLFTTLAVKGFCVPNDGESAEKTDGMDFEDIEAGGFDDGQGNQNVSSQAEADNLDVGGENSSSKPEDIENQDESDVEVTEDFDGSMEDVKDESQQGESFDEDEDDKEKESEDVQMGDIDSDQQNEIDRNMWAGEDKDENEDASVKNDESGGGTAVDEESRIVAKSHEAGEQPSDNQQDKEFGEPNIDEELSDQYDTSEIEPQPVDELDDKSMTDFENISVDSMEDQMSGGAESDEDGEIEGIDEATTEQALEQVDDEEVQQNSDPTDSVWSIDQRGYDGAEPINSDSVDDKTQSNSSGKDSQEVSQDHAGGERASSSESGNLGEALANFQKSLKSPQKSGIRRIPHRDRPHTQDYDGYEAKRQRLMNASERMTDIPMEKQESSIYQHVHDETVDNYDVAWDAAVHEQSGKSLPPPLLEDSPVEEDAATEACSKSLVESVNVSEPKSEAEESVQTLNSEMDTDTLEDKSVVMTGVKKNLDTFFSMVDVHNQKRVKDGDDQVRDGLMTAVNHLQQSQGTEREMKEATVIWMKYETLVFSLSQVLFDELRLILLPTKAAQLKGDYRSGKRINMRRIIPYIASNFQNDRIWLRRTKPSQREYQVLVAVDDSSSMHENQCKEMAYESLALVSSALSRLDCGQLGVCRFGETVEVLHSLEKPFSASSGGFILQHLMFNQTRTNFVELLRVAYSMFNGSLQKKSLEISQLLLILSDGRGVFADGVQAVEANIRRLNDIGVFTVFVILDSLSKDSVVDIKVPLFSPGKPPVIRNYLELFPFSYYIVLRDVKKMPVVFGQALRQWFELISSRSET